MRISELTICVNEYCIMQAGGFFNDTVYLLRHLLHHSE